MKPWFELLRVAGTMGAISPPIPVMPLLCAFSRHPAALQWALEQANRQWGPPSLVSPGFDFSQTEYYTPSMGPGLIKQFWVFDALRDPGELAAWKLQSNEWEETLARAPQVIGIAASEERPLNIDPGYLTAAKLVLASTKDHAHRMYLERGIYAEITLMYRHGGWQSHDFTFPDYQRADYQAFFTVARSRLKQLLAARC